MLRVFTRVALSAAVLAGCVSSGWSQQKNGGGAADGDALFSESST